MGKHEYYSPKAIGIRLKKKGIGKQKWYCQICRKQCRDDNGFKCHTESTAHLNQMAKFSENAEEYLEKFSEEFKQTFLQMLSSRYGTKKVRATLVYQDLVNDRVKLLLNATRWNTLTEFIKYLGRENYCSVEESENGWFIKWIDTSLSTVSQKKEKQRLERMKQIDEERERKLLEQQVLNSQNLKRKEMLTKANNNETEKTVETSTKKVKIQLNIKSKQDENIAKKKNLFKEIITKKTKQGKQAN